MDNPTKQPYIREIKDSTLKLMLVSYVQYPEYFMNYHFTKGMEDPEVLLGMLVIEKMSEDHTAPARMRAAFAVLACVSVYNETLARFEEFDTYFLKDILGEDGYNSLRRYVYTRPAFIPSWKKAHPKLANVRNLVNGDEADPNVIEYLTGVLSGDIELERNLDWSNTRG